MSEFLNLNLLRVFMLVIGIFGVSGYLHSETGVELLDPTRPKGWQASSQAQAETREAPAAAFQLQGTYSLAGERSAVISGQRVMVGDEVSGAHVLAIHKNTVVLQLDGETIELASLVPDVKSPANSKGAGR